jgi:hypothetical protein
MSVTDKDKGFKALFARLKGAKDLVLTVGVHGSEGQEPHGNVDAEGNALPPGPLTVADIATVHEYGLGTSPERSFIRAWADEQATKNNQTLAAIGKAVVQGKFTAEQGLERAGLRFVGDIQKRIKGNIPPPLMARTVARKKSSTPLINKGQLWSSIRHRVHKGGEA